MDCIGCRYYHNLADNHCFVCDGSGYTRPSNADRIRSMSDEELAEFLGDNDSNFPIGDHRKMWLDWLRQEAE